MRNQIRLTRGLVLGCGLVLAALCQAEQPIFYPAHGQTFEQEQADRAQCNAWATRATGIDPAALAMSPPPPPTDSSGTVAKTTLGGAAVGSIIGGIAGGNWGEGAGIGAVLGVLGGVRKSRQEQQQATQEADAQRQQTLDTYYRAVTACMKGRGYTAE